MPIQPGVACKVFLIKKACNRKTIIEKSCLSLFLGCIGHFNFYSVQPDILIILYIWEQFFNTRKPKGSDFLCHYSLINFKIWYSVFFHKQRIIEIFIGIYFCDYTRFSKYSQVSLQSKNMQTQSQSQNILSAFIE